MKLKAVLHPLYSELQGYLNQIPTIGEHGNSTTRDETLWTQFNSTIDELNTASNEDFNKFKITGIKHSQSYSYISVSELRMKLGGLIARLHGTYFTDEPVPFSGMPSTTINVSNQQEQSQYQTMIIELRENIDRKLNKLEEGEEKNFLTELKNRLSTVSDFATLIGLISQLGVEFNIGIDQLGRLFV